MSAWVWASIALLGCGGCAVVGAARVVEMPRTAYSLMQAHGYGNDHPIIRFVFKNPYARSICIPAASFDDRIAAIGVSYNGELLTRKEIMDIFPSEFSVGLYADSYFFVGPGGGLTQSITVKNFDMTRERNYKVSIKWWFYFCDELGAPSIAKGDDPRHTIHLHEEGIAVTAPW